MLLLVITGLIEPHFSDAAVMLRTAARTEGGERRGWGRGREEREGGGRGMEGKKTRV